IFDGDVLAFDKAGLLETLMKRGKEVRCVVPRPGAEYPDRRHRRLRARSRRKCQSCGAAERGNEVASDNFQTHVAVTPEITPLPMTIARRAPSLCDADHIGSRAPPPAPWRRGRPPPCATARRR